MGRTFKAPPKRSREQWMKVQILHGHGFRFDRYGRHGGAPLPKRLSEVETFLAKHPTHPLKTGQLRRRRGRLMGDKSLLH